jgi:hypothetical protein
MDEILKWLGPIAIMWLGGSIITILVLVAIDELREVWLPGWVFTLCTVLWPLTLGWMVLRVFWKGAMAAHMYWQMRNHRKACSICRRINARNVERRSYGGDPT